MKPTSEDLAAFVHGLEYDLLLPAFWLIRRSGLGAILEFYTPEERALEVIDDRLFTLNRPLYEFVQKRLEEN